MNEERKQEITQDLAFGMVKDKMLKPLGHVSENHADFDKLASPQMRKAVEQAKQGAGVVEVDPDFERTATPAQREARRQESLRKEKKTEQTELGSADSIRAKYKIEIRFMPGRTPRGPNLVGISIWESGKKFHGGGDERMFFCKDNREGHNDGCWGPIPGSYVKNGVGFCPKCNKGIVAKYLTDLRIFKLETQKLAQVVNTIFKSLGQNADIYCKYAKGDPHYDLMIRERGHDAAARYKGMFIYPLGRILKDTAYGADIEKCFSTFLSA